MADPAGAEDADRRAWHLYCYLRFAMSPQGSSYQLKDGVLFVTGSTRGAVLDTTSGQVYSINPEGCAVLRGEVEDELFWATLVSMGLAELTQAVRVQALPRKQDAERLSYLWLEIVTDDCNERCLHCYADSMPKTYRKALPGKQRLEVLSAAPARPKMKHQDWLAVLAEAAALGARECQFIGGEPFLYRGPAGETVIDLVCAARGHGFGTIEIYTNGTLITQDKAKQLKELGAQVAVSLYSDDATVHDRITRTPGSHAKTVSTLKMLKELGVPTRVEVVLMRPNQHSLESTLALREAEGWGGRAPDPLRPKGRGDDPGLQPDFEALVRYGLLLEPDFTAQRETIAHYATGHSCMLGRVAITEFGDVLPCIFTRNHPVGNLLVSRSLAPILGGASLRRIWGANKDQVMVCRDCEYRYVCFDCRPLSEAAAAGRADYLSAPYPRCTYNPYTGEWAAGLWQVDGDGQPYYDRSRAAQIQAVVEQGKNGSYRVTGH